jgi:hypothetical protein
VIPTTVSSFQADRADDDLDDVDDDGAKAALRVRMGITREIRERVRERRVPNKNNTDHFNNTTTTTTTTIPTTATTTDCKQQTSTARPTIAFYFQQDLNCPDMTQQEHLRRAGESNKDGELHGGDVCVWLHLNCTVVISTGRRGERCGTTQRDRARERDRLCSKRETLDVDSSAANSFIHHHDETSCLSLLLPPAVLHTPSHVETRPFAIFFDRRNDVPHRRF